jgi:Zn-dependent peptidase ImmA (M78 family)
MQINRNTYYESLKALAREKREHYAVNTASFGLREVRHIYKEEGIKIDYWPLPSRIKALYMCADRHFSVAVQRKLPDEPKLFALIHELKHHYTDQEIIRSGVVHCGDYNRNEPIEIGAEVFAAEFLYPEEEFKNDILLLGISTWKAEDVVQLKRNCKAKVSYQFLTKRLERLGVISLGQFRDIKFKNLEDQLYGIPYYRQRYKKAVTSF